MQKNHPISYIFFGSSDFSVIILDELSSAGYVPSLIVATPDKPKGRHLAMTAPVTKDWARVHDVPCIQPDSLSDEDVIRTMQSFVPHGYDIGITASYGKIIPQSILDIPRRGMLNVHPSLLPRLRGASPVQSAILSETETGVTIMLMDALMDHGPIVAQERVSIPDWPPYAADLEQILGHVGGTLLSKILPQWIEGTLTPQDQDHDKATICKKIRKDDAELDLSAPVEENLRKIRAYHIWPRAFFRHMHHGKEMRVIVTRARMEDESLVIERVIPEGGREMEYGAFLAGYSSIVE